MNGNEAHAKHYDPDEVIPKDSPILHPRNVLLHSPKSPNSVFGYEVSNMSRIENS